MQNPYQAPQSPQSAPQVDRLWHGPPSVGTDVRTVWGWFTGSWGMLLGISVGLSAATALISALGVALLPQFLGGLISIALGATVGLVISAAAIRVVLDAEDGRALGVGQALRFGFSRFGVLILPVALRYMFGALLSCLVFPLFLINGRLMSIEAIFVLGVEDPAKTVFGGAWELGDGSTLSFAGTWTLLYLPAIGVNLASGALSYAMMSPDVPVWATTLVTVPAGILGGFLAVLPALGGVARLLSIRHQQGLETEYRWRLLEE